MFKKLFLSAALISSTTAFAVDIDGTQVTFKVKQVIKDLKLVVIDSNPPVGVKPGKIFLATFPDKSQCPLVYRAANGGLLTFDGSACEKIAQLNDKVVIEPSLAEVVPTTAVMVGSSSPTAITQKDKIAQAEARKNAPAEPEAPRDPNKSFYNGKFGVILSYGSGTNFNFDNSKLNVGALEYEFDPEMKLEDQKIPGIAISYSRMLPNAWGFSGSLYYEFPREMKSFSGYIPGVGSTYSGGHPGSTRFSLALIEANIVWRADHFYTPFGVNVSIPHLSNGGSLHVRPMVGLYGAVGYLLNDNIGAEVFLRGVGIQVKDSNRPDLDFSTGVAASAGVSLRCAF